MPSSRSSAGDQSHSKSRAKKSSKTASPQAESADQAGIVAAELNFNQARSALELILAELQASDLNVEDMAALHGRAQAYARRCEQILEQVEQDVLLWDLSQGPDTSPSPYHS